MILYIIKTCEFPFTITLSVSVWRSYTPSRNFFLRRLDTKDRSSPFVTSALLVSRPPSVCLSPLLSTYRYNPVTSLVESDYPPCYDHYSH